MPYVFDNLLLSEPSCDYVNERDLAFAAQVADYWVHFATHAGSATTALPGPVTWEACTRGRDRLLRIGNMFIHNFTHFSGCS